MYGVTMPCGMIRFTCEKYPMITYMNAQMRALLRVTNENLQLLEYLRDNIFFMFPQEERERFRKQLDAVGDQGDVVTCRQILSCCDGKTVAVTGWLSKVKDQEGNPEYQAVYSGGAPMEEKQKESYRKNLIRMISREYDAVFSVDLAGNIVCCQKVNKYHISDAVQGIRMILEDAVKCWVHRLVVDEDQEKVSEFLKVFKETQKERLEFRASDKNGNVRNYHGEFLFIDSGSMLFCCRELEERETGELSYMDESVSGNGKIYIRTFGGFDVFVNGRAIPFSSKKAKELLALLVDRRGGFVTSNEAISFLWEDASMGESTRRRFRKVVSELRKTLAAYGIEEILIRINQESRINREQIQCDLYQYLEEGEEYKHLFKGEYMKNYSWAECTLGGLVNKEE